MDLEELGTPNQKAVYNRLGMMVGVGQAELSKNFSVELMEANTRALGQQTRAHESEVRRLSVLVKTDEHNRKFGAKLKLRNIESKQFDSNEE